MQWGAECVYPCRCNDAHVLVYDILDAIDAGHKDIGREEELEKRKRAEAGLRGIHLAARSKHFQVGPAPEKERIGCLHFLALAMLSIYRVPKPYRETSPSYWAAFATVAVELISRARKAHAKIPTEDIVARVNKIFRTKGDIELRRDITNGLVHVMADTKTYGEWLALEKVLGRTIDEIFEHWLGVVREIQDADGAEARNGAAGAIEIWRYVALLYAQEVDSRASDAEKRQVALLGREVLTKALLVLDIVEGYYKSFRGNVAHDCAERVTDVLYWLVKGGTVAEDWCRPLRTKAESILRETDCQYVRGHFQEIVRVLRPELSGGEDTVQGADPLPPRK